MFSIFKLDDTAQHVLTESYCRKVSRIWNYEANGDGGVGVWQRSLPPVVKQITIKISLDNYHDS